MTTITADQRFAICPNCEAWAWQDLAFGAWYCGECGVMVLPPSDEWVAATVVCEACGHEHASVHPVECSRVECSACGHMTPAMAGALRDE